MPRALVPPPWEPNVREGNLVFNPTEGTVSRFLESVQPTCALDLRRRLKETFPTLREKLNTGRRPYIGFKVEDASDSLYFWVQKGCLLISARVRDRDKWTVDLRSQGFEVRPNPNDFQGRNGWLTGVRVPHDADDLDPLVRLAVEALGGA